MLRSKMERPSVGRLALVGAVVSMCGVLAAAAPAARIASGHSSAKLRGDSSVPTLKIGIPALGNTVFAPIYAAQHRGYFAAAGVNVKLVEGLGSNTVNSVVSGQVDLAFLGTSGLLSAAKSGADTIAVYGSSGGGSSTCLFVLPTVKHWQDIHTLVTLAPGSEAYGLASLMKQTAHAGFDIRPVADYPTALALVLSGQAQAIELPYSVAAPVAAQGKLKIFVDTQIPADEKIFGIPPGLDGALFGMRSNVSSKRTAVVRFLKAFQRAVVQLHVKDKAQRTKNIASIAAAVTRTTSFKSYSTTDLANYLSRGFRQIAPNNGYISSSDWSSMLKFIGTWGLNGFDPTTAAFAYGLRVDMTYYNAAIGKPKS